MYQQRLGPRRTSDPPSYLALAALAFGARAHDKPPRLAISEQIRTVARRTLRIEEAALARLQDSIDDDFVACVTSIFRARGRLIVTGIGKTAIVAQKIVATLNSTGTPAIFLHAADAIHGDLGMILPDDLVLCLSKSGETAEMKVLASLVHQLGNPLIAMVGRPDSSLARRADFVLRTPIDREADPNNLAPTTSTTAQMALGDAMATSLLSLRGFTARDFAQYHPGGNLGKRLYLGVNELAAANQRPAVQPTAPLREIILEITAKCLGATAVLEPKTECLLGIITDGDLRRMLREPEDVDHLLARDIMTPDPQRVRAGSLAVKALERMRIHEISQLPVVDEDDRYQGMIHLHDLVREGII